jgi:hypothetical protein
MRRYRADAEGRSVHRKRTNAEKTTENLAARCLSDPRGNNRVTFPVQRAARIAPILRV